MAETDIHSTEAEKTKRQYNRKPAPIPPPAPPAPPSAAVIELESDVLALVKQRMAANQEIADATIAANQASARVQAANARLAQLEHEVQYRLALISQMKGDVRQTNIRGISDGVPEYQMGLEPATWPTYGGIDRSASGIGSIPPAAPLHRTVQTGPRVRSESAAGFREEEVGVRAAI